MVNRAEQCFARAGDLKAATLIERNRMLTRLQDQHVHPASACQGLKMLHDHTAQPAALIGGGHGHGANLGAALPQPVDATTAHHLVGVILGDHMIDIGGGALGFDLRRLPRQPRRAQYGPAQGLIGLPVGRAGRAQQTNF